MSNQMLRCTDVSGEDRWTRGASGCGLASEAESESESETEAGLVGLCLEAATESRSSVEGWRRQVRSLERMPPHLADALLRRVTRRRLLYPSLLEVFKYSVEEIDLRRETKLDAEWMAYLGAFCSLRSLNVADCRRLTNDALWPITGLTNLRDLNLSRCPKVSDATVRHLIQIPTLERLWIPETGITGNGIKLLSSLTRLTLLDLGGLRVTDLSLCSLQVLTELQYLDLWGSDISNKGAVVLNLFPKLSFLSLAWTSVTVLPNLSSLTCLDMSNCLIDSIFKDKGGNKAPLEKLVASGATFRDIPGAFANVDSRFLSSLDLSNATLHSFCFLHNMTSLQHLDLSSSKMGDDSVELIASIGAKLREINFSNTKVSSAGLGILAGHTPNLEVISLSQTSIDDMAIPSLGLMPSLKVINLSGTKIKGVIPKAGNELEWVLSLTSLQILEGLERLDLEDTQFIDAALRPLDCFQELRELYLKCASLTDLSLPLVSSAPKLTKLGIRNAVLTNGALDSFKPPENLKSLDLGGCWLLTKDAISSFCDKYPQIEVWHDSYSSASAKDLKLKQNRRRRVPVSQGRNSPFADQRLRYGIDELLALNHSSLRVHNRLDELLASNHSSPLVHNYLDELLTLNH